MAIYSKENENSSDENVRIKKTETKEIESFISVSELKQRHQSILQEIERMKEEADKLVDTMQEISDDESIDLVIKDIPSKLIINKK